MAGVLAAAVPQARWFVSQVGYAQTFSRLAGVSGALTFYPLPDGTMEPNFLGFPVSFSAKLPNTSSSQIGKPMIFFGNLKQSSLIVEHRVGTIVATSFERAVDADQVLVRGTRRLDIVNHLGTGADLTATGNFAPMAMLTGTT